MKEASRYNLISGSTATVVLIAEGQILVANVGDSKALLCSENFQTPAEAKGSEKKDRHYFSTQFFVNFFAVLNII